MQKNVDYLKNIDCFRYKQELSDFELCIDNSLKIADLENFSKTDYLKSLRRCDKLYEKIKYLYAREVRESIEQDDYSSFHKLLSPKIDKNSSLKEEILKYYKKSKKEKIPTVEDMIADIKNEQESRKEYEQEYAAYEEHLAVLSRERARAIRKTSSHTRRNSVLISTEKKGDGYDFFAENFNIYTVTIKLDLKEQSNIKLDKRTPLYFELPAKSSKKVLHVSIKNPRKTSSFHSSYSWRIGSAWAKHSDVYYHIPFKKGSKIRISQGFNGKTSHKNKFAIDFAVDIGTPIYAARGGTVVAFESSHNRGKFDRRYSKYANYLIIEHNDKTLGR